MSEEETYYRCACQRCGTEIGAFTADEIHEMAESLEGDYPCPKCDEQAYTDVGLTVTWLKGYGQGNKIQEEPS